MHTFVNYYKASVNLYITAKLKINFDIAIAFTKSFQFVFLLHFENISPIIQPPLLSYPSAEDATIFVAVAARQGISDQIHVEVSDRHILDVWFRSDAGSDVITNQMTDNVGWRQLDFEESPWWNLNGLYFDHYFPCLVPK